MVGLPSGTVTFLLTDVEGSTALWEQAPAAMRVALSRHDHLFEVAVRDHDGAHIRPRGEGDSRFAVFASVADAVSAALTIQRAFAVEPWPTPCAIKVRIGVHTGEAQLRESDYYGSAVNRCARIRGIGHGGQTLLSEATAALARDDLPDDASLVDLGEHRLKDLTRPERVFQLTVPDLPSDFPRLVSLNARPHNLPIQPTSLIGRQREVRAVHDLLARDDVRLVTLTGTGGTGKTRLGLQVAAELLDQFNDGAIFVELAPISDPAFVVSTIAQALGVRDVGGRPVLETLKEYLYEKQVLLLLDNFEQILLAAPSIAELLGACRGLKVLVTSRAALHLRGEHEVPVPPLALPEPGRRSLAEDLATYPAVALFSQRAMEVRPDFALTDESAVGVAEICRRLDGLPLAIELAAARVKLLTPRAMLARLERRLPLLTGGARDLPERQRTLRDTITWSYDLLDEAERRLFRRIAVFVGGCTLEALEAICDVDGDLGIELLEGVASLVDKSLLRQEEDPEGEARFTMLETIREYGFERLDECGEAESLRSRHAICFLALVEQAEPKLQGPEQGRWLMRLEAEHDNVRSALAWSRIEPGRAEVGLRLAGALYWFWYIRGHLSEGRGWLAGLLTRSDAVSTSVHAKALLGAGWLAMVQGDYAVSCTHLSASAELRQHLCDKSGRGRSLTALAVTEYFMGRISESDELLQESEQLLRDVGDRWGLAQTLRQLAANACAEGALEAAATFGREGVAHSRATGDQYALGVGLAQLGRMHLLRREYAPAEAAFKEALVSLVTVGERWWSARCALRLAWIAYAQAYHTRAARLAAWGEARLAAIGTRLHGVEQADLGRAATLSRSTLGEQAFAAVWAEGRAMSLEQAIAYACEEPAPT